MWSYESVSRKTHVSSSFPGPLIVHSLLVLCPFNFLNGYLKQQWSHIGVFLCYQNIDAKKEKLNLHIYGIHLLNPYKTVVSHLKAGLFICCKGNKNQNNCKVSSLETPSFLKIQRELRHRQCAWKVLGLSRNRPLTHINLFNTKFECFTHVTPQFLSNLTFHSFQIPNTHLEKANNLEHDKIHFAQN